MFRGLFRLTFWGGALDRQPDVIMTGYGKGLVAGFSKKVKSIIRSAQYQKLFPGVTLARGSNSVRVAGQRVGWSCGG